MRRNNMVMVNDLFIWSNHIYKINFEEKTHTPLTASCRLDSSPLS